MIIAHVSLPAQQLAFSNEHELIEGPGWNLTEEGISQDILHIQKTGAIKQTLASSSGTHDLHIFSHSNFQQKSTIHFIPWRGKETPQSFIKFLADKQLIDFDKDGVILPECFLGTHPYLKDISIETSEMLSSLVAQKCHDAGVNCNYEEKKVIANELSRALRTITFKGSALLPMDPISRRHHLKLLPGRHYQVGYYDGNPAFEEIQNNVLKNIIEFRAKGAQNIWILARPEMIPLDALVNLSLLKQVLEEEKIAKENVGITNINQCLSSIYIQTVIEKINIDPYEIWLPQLPHILFDGLGALSFDAYYAGSLLSIWKESIRQRVLNKVRDETN